MVACRIFTRVVSARCGSLAILVVACANEPCVESLLLLRSGLLISFDLDAGVAPSSQSLVMMLYRLWHLAVEEEPEGKEKRWR